MTMCPQFRLYKTMELQINWSVKLSDNNPLWLMVAGNTSPAQSPTSPSREYADTSGGQSKHDCDNFKLHIFIINIFLLCRLTFRPVAHIVLKCRIRKRLLHYALIHWTKGILFIMQNRFIRTQEAINVIYYVAIGKDQIIWNIYCSVF